MDDVQANTEDYVLTMQSKNSDVFVGLYVLLYHATRVLKQGFSAYDETTQNNIPTMAEARKKYGSNCFMFQSVLMFHNISLAYLLRRFEDMSLDSVDMSGDIERKKHSLIPTFMFGLFYEGLTSFLLARQTRDSERLKWIEKGESVLTKMTFWSEHSSWNWESKMVVLEAEKMYTMGNCDLASMYYDKAIRVAHEHKFINDEAIARELAGTFFCYQGLHVRAKTLLLQSAQNYKTWGATAVAKRVEALIASKYGNEQRFNDTTLQVQSNVYDVCQPVLNNGRTQELLSEEQKRSASHFN